MESIQGTKTLVRQCAWLAMNVQPVRFSVKSTSVSPGVITLPVLAGVHGQLVLSFRVTADTTFKTEIKAQGLETIQGLGVGESYFIQPNLIGEVIFQSNGSVWEVQNFQATLTAPLVIEGFIDQIGTDAPIVYLETPLPAGFTITPVYVGVGSYRLVLPTDTFIVNRRHMLIQSTKTTAAITVSYSNPIPINSTNINIKCNETMTGDPIDGSIMMAPFRLTIWPNI